MADSQEVERLRHALEAAEQRASAAEQHLSEERQRAAAAEQHLTEERQRAEVAEHLTKRTSFPEFLELCHKHFTEPLRVETDQSLTTKGSITNPRSKKHPTFLQPWQDFPRLQQQYFDEAYRLLCQDEDASGFTPRIALQEEGQALCERALASEKDLEHYDRSAVEEKVRQVIRRLLSMDRARDLVNHCTDLEFHNHLNGLSEVAEEDGKRPRASAVDQACIFRRGEGGRSLLLVREYKPAHKLTSEYLRAGLRPMTVRDEVVQRPTIPNDPGEKLKYNADRLVAAAVTQTFEYMIDNGLEYSSIATGLAEVYLRVPEDDPATVYYYLTEPKLDVAHDDEFGFRYPYTAVGRLLGFSLMALHSHVRSQEWRRAACERLHLWSEDFDEILHQIPSDERKDSPEGSLYSSPQYPVDPRSPYLLRRQRLVSRNDDEPHATSFSSHSSSDGPDDGTSGVPETPSRPPTTKRKRTSTEGASRHDRGGQEPTGHSQAREYCTMKCLSGIRYQRDLDPACPNYAKHRQTSQTSVHQLDLVSFSEHVRSQLEADMDHHCDPLGIQGSRGALFKITLTSHGYTFVAKGTVEGYRADLYREGRIYRRLFPIQGTAVPVYLGNIDLRYPYYYDVGVKIVHMLLMSWGGVSLYDQTPPISCSFLEEEKQRSLRDISQLSVDHGDCRLPNMLWNEEKRRVLVVDFERSRVRVPVKKRRYDERSDILPPLASKKRKLVQPVAGTSMGVLKRLGHCPLPHMHPQDVSP